ncbi:MAG: hypothetical protein AB7O24_13420 [Kofleriaceae bacterium]
MTWDHAIEGPLASAQPWLSGMPVSSPATFWRASLLDSIHSHAHLVLGEDPRGFEPNGNAELVGVRVPALTSRPTRTFAAATIDVFEAEIPGRNAGRAIAIYDRANKRHRWVVVTRGCVQGTTVRWLGAIGTKLIGMTESRHARYQRGDAILVIDVLTGTAWAISYPEPIRTARMERAGRIAGSLSTSSLTLRFGRVSQTIDLAPLLQRIH